MEECARAILAVHGGQWSPLSHWRSVLTAEHSTVKFRHGWRGWRGVVPLIPHDSVDFSVASDVPDLPGIQRPSFQRGRLFWGLSWWKESKVRPVRPKLVSCDFIPTYPLKRYSFASKLCTVDTC